MAALLNALAIAHLFVFGFFVFFFCLFVLVWFVFVFGNEYFADALHSIGSGYYSIGSEGAKALGLALQTNNTLKELK